jgi:hypothetical protein
MISTTHPAVNGFKNQDPQPEYLIVNPMGHGYHGLGAGFAGSGILFVFLLIIFTNIFWALKA